MKKRLTMAVLGLLLALGLCACGNDDVKVITRDGVETGAENEKEENGDTDDDADDTDDEDAGKDSDDEEELKGYVFTADGIDMAMDMEMEDVLAKLGEPVSYFEAASCAFQGLDKVYTYNHYEIDTYPDGEEDRISSIILKDDLIATPEGLSIGMTKTDMENAYGTGYETNGNMRVYTKDGMHLSILVENDAVTSIQYNSAALDSAN